MSDGDGRSAIQLATEQASETGSERFSEQVDGTRLVDSRIESATPIVEQHGAAQGIAAARESAAIPPDTASGYSAATTTFQLKQPTVLHSGGGGVQASRMQAPVGHLETRSYVPVDAVEPSQFYAQQAQRGRLLSQKMVSQTSTGDVHVFAGQQVAAYELPSPVVVNQTATTSLGREISEDRSHRPVLEPLASLTVPVSAETGAKTEILERDFPQLPPMRPDEKTTHDNSGVESSLVAMEVGQAEAGEVQAATSTVVLSTKRVPATADRDPGMLAESGSPVVESIHDASQPETVQLAAATLDGLQLTLPVARPDSVASYSPVFSNPYLPVSRPRSLSTGAQIAVTDDERSSTTSMLAAKPGNDFNSAGQVILSSHGNGLNLNKLLLIGTFGTESNRKALVRFPNGEVYQIRVGSKLKGGQVVAIKTDSVILVANNQSYVLE